MSSLLTNMMPKLFSQAVNPKTIPLRFPDKRTLVVTAVLSSRLPRSSLLTNMMFRQASQAVNPETIPLRFPGEMTLMITVVMFSRLPRSSDYDG